MKSPLGWLMAVVVPFALASVGCGDASRAEAESATQSWVAQHAEGWEVEGTKGLGVMTDVSACINALVLVRTSTPRADVSLLFDCPENDVLDLTWLRAHSRGYDLVLRVPIDAPGWTFAAHSPSTATTEGLTFESWQNQELALRLDTQMFAIWGQSQSSECVQARMGQDGDLPESCWVDTPWEGTAVVHMDVPLAKESLQTPPPIRP